MSSGIESNPRYLLVESGLSYNFKKQNVLFKKVKSFFSSFKPSLDCFSCSQNPRNPDRKNQFRGIDPDYLEVVFLDQKHLKQDWEYSVSSRDLNRFSNDNIPSPQISKGKQQKNKSTDPEVEIFEV